METIHLIGAEDVARAGSTIQSSAETMSRAAGTIDATMATTIRTFEEFVSRIEVAAQSVERLADSVDDLRNEMIARFGDECSVADCIQLGPASTHIHVDTAQRQPCPGCIDCGPPIVVKAADRCGRTPAKGGEYASLL